MSSGRGDVKTMNGSRLQTPSARRTVTLTHAWSYERYGASVHALIMTGAFLGCRFYHYVCFDEGSLNITHGTERTTAPAFTEGMLPAV